MDDPLTLKCCIEGTPNISVAWFKADGKLRKSNTCSVDFTDGVATLKLMKTTKFDHGEYICKAENRVGSASTSCNVIVKGDFLYLFFHIIHPAVIVHQVSGSFSSADFFEDSKLSSQQHVVSGYFF